ncbi:MAG: Stp1/IreP family PP2C-type Ser/Thr phosphatase [Clostridiales Family XIII bacterium]|nr:Stp1/IreP family PP2C-type Ser/Thr phosphatase [Clostridiales Family XIII bacterium]
MALFGYRTDIGRKREKNEDALMLLPALGIYAVADGVGGLSSGEVASRKAVDSIEEFIAANPLSGADNLDGKYRENWMRGYFARCLQKANSEILSLAMDHPQYLNMATTIVLMYMDVESLYIVNMGDSRAYILRDGQLGQLTVDHTYVNSLVEAGAITRNEARFHPKKNMITKALGAGRNADPEFHRFDLHEGDRLLLCSDGLHEELSDDEIARILRQDGDLTDVCRHLVDAANKNGGSDNITLVCVDNRN